MRTLRTAILYTAVTALLFGIGYPLLITGLARILFPAQADGSLLQRNGVALGSHLIGQPFTGPRYFHSRPSAAGAGYDATASGGSNLAATNSKLVDRIAGDVRSLASESNGAPVPIDLVTASGSGLDPDITPAAAEYQVQTVAKARGLRPEQVRAVVEQHTYGRQFGILGEPRVNVLELNLALDQSR
jgi:K+-transporting ATPase ATPase C chain